MTIQRSGTHFLNTHRSYTLRSVPSSPGRSLLLSPYCSWRTVLQEGKGRERDDRMKPLQLRVRRLHHSQSGAASAFPGGLEVLWMLPARDCRKGRNDFSSDRTPCPVNLDNFKFKFVDKYSSRNL